MSENVTQPGSLMEKRPLNMIFLLDCSSSMMGDKIAAVNSVMAEAVADLKALDSEPTTFGKIQFRSIRFGSGASWHVKDATDIQKTVWSDLPAAGVTDLGAAYGLLKNALEPGWLGKRVLPPVLVLLSDGQPTDNWRARLAELKTNRYWKHCVRIAIAIGKDADHEPLKEFIDWKGNDHMPLFTAYNRSQLQAYIRWASTDVSGSIIKSNTNGTMPDGVGGVVPPPPPPTKTVASDIW